MNSEQFISEVSPRVPAAALDYCKQLWQQYQFRFRLRKTRVTKIGDFTFRHGHTPRITVNQELHPYLFLITYLHEVAHLQVHHEFGNRVEGHGEEWKGAFRKMIEPVLNENIFPKDLLLALQAHMEDPRATTYSDPELMNVLRRYDPSSGTQILLADIPEGSIFGIRGRWFKKGPTKRTRALCREITSKRKYFVPVDAPVENVQLSLL